MTRAPCTCTITIDVGEMCINCQLRASMEVMDNDPFCAALRAEEEEDDAQ